MYVERFVHAIICLVALSPLYVYCQTVKVTTLFTLPGTGTFNSITSSNGDIYASGITSGGAGVIYSVQLAQQTESAAVNVVAGSVLTTYQDGVGTNAGLFGPTDMALDPRATHRGQLYFSDQMLTASDPYVIRKLVISTGVVTTVLGNGARCTYPTMLTPSSGFANASTACYVRGLTMDNNGNLYFLDENILRVFQVDFGTVSTIVGSYNGNPNDPNQYLDNANGLSAYLANPASVVLSNNSNGSSIWVLDRGTVTAIHQVNASNVAFPMMTVSLTTASNVAASGAWLSTCARQMSIGAFYLIAGCLSTSVSGQVLTVDSNSLSVTALAGGGSCQPTDGQGQSASFHAIDRCTSVSASSSGELLLVIDETLGPNFAGTIRAVTIGSPPNGPTSSSALAMKFNTMSVLIIALLVAALQIVIFIV